MAEQLHAPQQRGSVDQVCHFAGTGGANFSVIHIQRTIGLPLRQMEQRQVPPAMRGDHGSRTPAGHVLIEPERAGVGAFGHLEDMCHHVVCACVARVQRQCRPGDLLGARVLTALAESEAVHGQHGVVAGHPVRPGRQHRRDAVAHARRFTGDVVQRMRHLQREHVARVTAQQLAQTLLGILVVVVEHGRDGRQVQSLALVGRQLGGECQHGARRTHPTRIAAAQQQIRLQRVCHHKTGSLLQGHRKGFIGTAAPRLERGERSFVGVEGGRLGTRNSASAQVEVAHGGVKQWPSRSDRDR